MTKILIDLHESCIGFYKTGNTSGTNLAVLIMQHVSKTKLPLDNLCGQTYDGAGNMSSILKGTQLIIIGKQPLAEYSL